MHVAWTGKLLANRLNVGVKGLIVPVLIPKVPRKQV